MDKKLAPREHWNAMAKQFDELKIPQWGEDPFLKQIEKLPVWDGNATVLDLGCGAGRYAIAVAPRCKEVVGTDISDGMIDYANQKKVDYNADNAVFYCEDWADVDPAAQGYEKKFDFIFGHMTPALNGIDGIKKANQCCKGYCAMASFQKREAPQQEGLLEFLGMRDDFLKTNRIPEIFDYLYNEGMCPEVTYYDRDDTRVMEPEKAIEFYINNLHLSNEVTEEVKEKIREYVMMNLTDGKMVNKVTAKIVVFFWNTNTK